MNEIEVGEYIRTRNYGIKRVDIINQNATVNKYGYEIGSDWEGKEYRIVKTTEVLNHSKNIIKLIEVGDFGVFFDKNLPAEYIYQIVINNEGKCTINNYEDIKIEDIKTILTKEQYEQNCYRLEE